MYVCTHVCLCARANMPACMELMHAHVRAYMRVCVCVCVCVCAFVGVCVCLARLCLVVGALRLSCLAAPCCLIALLLCLCCLAPWPAAALGPVFGVCRPCRLGPCLWVPLKCVAWVPGPCVPRLGWCLLFAPPLLDSLRRQGLCPGRCLPAFLHTGSTPPSQVQL